MTRLACFAKAAMSDRAKIAEAQIATARAEGYTDGLVAAGVAISKEMKPDRSTQFWDTARYLKGVVAALLPPDNGKGGAE
jgi:hypothetical protein